MLKKLRIIFAVIVTVLSILDAVFAQLMRNQAQASA